MRTDCEINKSSFARERIYCFSFAIIVAAVSILIGWFLWLEDKSISDENHYLENLQLLFLILAFGFHVKQRACLSLSTLRTCHLTLAVLCFSVFLREYDIDKTGIHVIWNYLEITIRLITLFVWIYIATYVLINFWDFWEIRWNVLRSTNSLPTAIAIGLYLCSWPFDKNYIPVEPDLSQLYEESIQLTATIFFFASSLRPIRFSPSA